MNGERNWASRESTLQQIGGASMRRQNLNSMMKNNDDDDDNNNNPIMSITENPSTTAAIGGSYSYENNNSEFNGGGGEMKLGLGEMKDVEEEPMLCQLVGGESTAGTNHNGEGSDGGGNGGRNGLPAFQEVDMGEDDDDDDDDDLALPPVGNGSDVSSADKYADRNSDPGIQTAEADYPLPIPNQFSNNMNNNPDRFSRIANNNNRNSSSRLDIEDSSLPMTNNMNMTNVMDPNNIGGLRLDHHHNENAAAPGLGSHPNPMPGGYNHGAIGAGGIAGGGESINNETATQTHEVRMPMLTPTFKPATGCTNASDFIVRCFVARLRSGITVVKHGRSRWCKSRLRVLHVHPDGRSLSWKPALGEPSSGKRPPKLDLTSCKEVRHAWSPDPDNPMFTGTPILRQKCEAANAHKSFALIFPRRTVDITAVTADQCKVLMEGFSALCFRLQVAQNVAASGAGEGEKAGSVAGKSGEDGATTTASVTLTNNSTSVREGSPKKKGGKKRNLSLRP